MGPRHVQPGRPRKRVGRHPERLEATEGILAGSDLCLLNSLKITLMPDGGGPGEDRAAGRDIIRRPCSLPGQEKMEGMIDSRDVAWKNWEKLDGNGEGRNQR